MPYKFEAGTPNIAGALGLAAAIEYLTAIGFDRVTAHEHELLVYGTKALLQTPGLRLTGEARDKVGVLSFVKVDVVWDPPWDRDRMSEAARLQLGLF